MYKHTDLHTQTKRLEGHKELESENGPSRKALHQRLQTSPDISAPPPKNPLQTTTRKLSTDIRNEPPDPSRTSVGKLQQGTPHPSLRTGQPHFYKPLLRNPPYHFRRQVFSENISSRFRPPSLPKKLHNNPPPQKIPAQVHPKSLNATDRTPCLALVAPCGWDFNRGRGRGWESRPLSRFRFALVLKGFETL